MCHLLLLAPVIALPIFWLMPAGPAVTIYTFIALASGILYWFIIKSIRQPVTTGAEGLIGTKAEVVSLMDQLHNAQYLVRSQGELWSACSPQPLQPGERVSITAVNGITLVVSPPGSGPDAGRHNYSKKQGRSNERHCY